MKITFDHNSQSFPIDLTPTGKSYRAIVGDETVDVVILRVDAERGRLDLQIIRYPLQESAFPAANPLQSPFTDSQSVTLSAYVSSDGARRWVTINGQTMVLTKASGTKRKSTGHEHASELAAPMPGLVRSVNVVEGEAVAKGQTLMVLEAMKMEIRIQTKSDGVVKKLFVKQGQIVEREQALIEIE